LLGWDLNTSLPHNMATILQNYAKLNVCQKIFGGFPETDSGQDGPNALRYAREYMDCAD
jgi:hypothetical protein